MKPVYIQAENDSIFREEMVIKRDENNSLNKECIVERIEPTVLVVGGIRPAIYRCSASTFEELKSWMEEEESKKIENGIFKGLIENFENFGYMLKPSVAGSAVSSIYVAISEGSTQDNDTINYRINDLNVSFITSIIDKNSGYDTSDIEEYIKEKYDIQYDKDIKRQVATGCIVEIGTQYYTVLDLQMGNEKVKCVWKTDKRRVWGDRISNTIYCFHKGMYIEITFSDTEADKFDLKKLEALSFEIVPFDMNYVINYVLDGGVNDSYNPFIYKEGGFTLGNPVKAGYIFDGWYTDAQFTKPIISIEAGSKTDLTVYAKWKKVTRPSKVKIKKAVLKGKKKAKFHNLKLKWKEVNGAEGYEILYHSGKGFKNAKKITTSSLSRTVKALKKGKRYYIKIRAYKLDSLGKKVYGKYSVAKQSS